MAFTKRSGLRVAFPEAEWRQQYAENPDGSVGESLLNYTIRQAITVDARVKPNYAGIRVPVLAIYQAQRPFEEVAAEYDIRNEQERAALRQQYMAVRTMYTRWQNDLLAAVPTARVVELVGDPSLMRGLTTKWLALFVPVGAQATTVAIAQRVAVISPENSGLASAPAALPFMIMSPFWSAWFSSAIVATIALFVSGSPALM